MNVEAGEQMARPSMCLLTGKLRFEEEEDAAASLASFSSIPGRKVPQRVYCCPLCAGWHLTSVKTYAPPKEPQ